MNYFYPNFNEVLFKKFSSKYQHVLNPYAQKSILVIGDVKKIKEMAQEIQKFFAKHHRGAGLAGALSLTDPRGPEGALSITDPNLKGALSVTEDREEKRGALSLTKDPEEKGKDTDEGMLTPGGIDLNPNLMNMDFQKSQGISKDFILTDEAMMRNFQIGKGLTPVIVHITAVENVLHLIGF